MESGWKGGHWPCGPVMEFSLTRWPTGKGHRFQAPVSSLPWTQLVQFSGPGTTFVNPYGNQPEAAAGFIPPAGNGGGDVQGRAAPYAQNWNLSLQRGAGERTLWWRAGMLERKGTRLPRNIEANPAVWGTGGDGSERGPAAHLRQLSDRRIGLPTGARGSVVQTSPIRHTMAGKLTVSKRFSGGLGFSGSYWFSKTLDYLSAMNLTGAAARPLSGEVDIAQNPFDLFAEHGPSLFDARHRFCDERKLGDSDAEGLEPGCADRAGRVAVERNCDGIQWGLRLRCLTVQTWRDRHRIHRFRDLPEAVRMWFRIPMTGRTRWSSGFRAERSAVESGYGGGQVWKCGTEYCAGGGHQQCRFVVTEEYCSGRIDAAATPGRSRSTWLIMRISDCR